MVGLGAAFRRPTVDRPGMVESTGWLGACPQPANETLPNLAMLGALERRIIVGCRLRVGRRIDDRLGFDLIDVAGWRGPDVVAGFGLF